MKKNKELLTDVRRVEENIKRSSGKLGEETIAVMPEDIRLMYAGYMAINLLKSKVAFQNKIFGLKKSYEHIYPEIEEELTAEYEAFLEGFNKAKKRLSKIADNHPLSQRICQIKGFTSYQLALIMCYTKDISRFQTPSRYMVYAGVASKYGLKVCKRNLNAIRQLEHKYNPNKETEFGFNTRLQGRMYSIVDNLMRAGGYFYAMYQNQRERLIERAINNDECTKATKADEKASKGKMKAGRYYMNGRTNQSIEAWSNSNARWRIARTLLHLIYTEWRAHIGLESRNPYPIDFLGHSQYITLDDVIEWEKNN